MRTSTMLQVLLFLPIVSLADFSSFSTGPVIDDFGPVAAIDTNMAMPKDARFRHSFDVSERAEDGKPNRTLVSAARFINMHARAGIEPDRIDLAIVVHGTAVHDVSGKEPDSAALVAALVDHGVRIIVCGQSAAYYGVAMEDLLPKVEMAISAMTAHALLQQQGYTINPF